MNSQAIHIVGHPSAPIGMGEHARSVYRALRTAGVKAKLVDVYGPTADADRQLISTYASDLSVNMGGGVNIFCMNADEMAQALPIMKRRNLDAPGSRKVIYPAWELSRFPAEWGLVLDQFDEVWAPSKFIAEAVARTTRRPVIHMPLACEIGERALVSRRHFGIPESAYSFLFAFDFLSFLERKNPAGAIKAFCRFLEIRPHADARLVLKLNNSSRKPEAFEAFKESFAAAKDRITIIDRALTDLEMKALIWLNDCFVSMHRCEGFGRGMSEAMVLGKPVIATAYSGNMDFCSEHTCKLLPYELISVGEGQYPFWHDQVWAEPDIEAAAQAMVELYDDPESGREIGGRARCEMVSNFSYLARGLAYANRCKELFNCDLAA